MLTVTSARDPIWVAIAPGTRIQLKLVGSLGIAAGRDAARAAVIAGGNETEALAAFTIGIVAQAALAWEGVGDEAGEILPLTRANVVAMLEQNQVAYDAVDTNYVIPALEAEAEKNGSSPLLDGTSPAGALTRKTRARSPGAAGTTAGPAPKPAKPVPTN